jgi:hypothetical protein
MPCQPDHERNSAAWYSTIAVENPNVMQIHSHVFGDETSFQWLLRPLMIFAWTGASTPSDSFSGIFPQPPISLHQKLLVNPPLSNGST